MTRTLVEPDGDRGVIAPPLAVARGPADLGLDRPRGEAVGRQQIVDPPAGVEVECLTSPRPPAVRARTVAPVMAAQVGPARGEPAVEVGPLSLQEPRLAAVALPVLEVLFAMRHIQVTGD